jgi:tetratricopeptide (TPR) repeat protein
MADKFWIQMKKLLIIVIFIVLGANVARAVEPLADANKEGLSARSIEEVLRLDPDQVDLGIAALIISEKWSDMVQGRKYQSELDDMAYAIRERMRVKRVPANFKAVEVINKYLYEELGFTAVKDANDANDLFLHNVLDKRHGYCLSLSVLYLAIGERLGLPLYGVVVPGHFFVRYDDGQVRFNIEPTSKGGFADDEHYIREFKVPRNNGTYLKNLNKIQTIGCFFNNLGNIYSQSGDIDSAMTVLEKAVQINPSLADCHTNLGNVYLKKDRVYDAIRQYRLAMEINPADAVIHSNLGNAYLRQERYADAAAEFNEAIGIDPKQAENYKRLALAYSKQKLYSSAKAAVRDAMAMRPNDAECYKLLGDIYREEGNCREAIFQYTRANEFKRDYAEAYFATGLCYGKLGQADDEISAYKKAIEYNSGMAPAMLNLGNAYMSQKDYDGAIELYKRAMKAESKESLVYYNLGVAYSYKNNFEEASKYYLKAVELSPKMADAHNGLALAFYRLKQYDLAMHYLKQAEELGAKINPDLLKAIQRELK